MRKALGQHEIALVQTTAIDEATRTVRLNTVLAHSSGEWIASDWPVCPMSDMNSPQRMGAALTYARRYALFTLVGIAGEDDLDAPDLNVANSGPATAETTSSRPASVARKAPFRKRPRWRPVFSARNLRRSNRPILAADESARLREGMLAEIESIASSAAATAWANTMLRAKNTLTADDARSVESAFETKFAGLATDDIAEPMQLLLPVLSPPATMALSRTTATAEPASADARKPQRPQSADHQDRAPPQQGAPPICAHATVSDLRQAAV